MLLWKRYFLIFISVRCCNELCTTFRICPPLPSQKKRCTTSSNKYLKNIYFTNTKIFLKKKKEEVVAFVSLSVRKEVVVFVLTFLCVLDSVKVKLPWGYYLWLLLGTLSPWTCIVQEGTVSWDKKINIVSHKLTWSYWSQK